MKKVYVINGLPESGKTLFGQVVGEKLRAKGINFLHTSSIDPVKRILRPKSFWDSTLTDSSIIEFNLERLKKETTDLDWDGVTKDDYWRRKMSELKARMTEYMPNLINRLVLDQFNGLDDPCVGFVDIREPENIEAFKKECKETRVGIEVTKVLVMSDKSREFLNPSDSRVNESIYDIVIDNRREVFRDDSIALWFLRSRVDAFIDQEILGHRSKERFY